DNGAGNDVHVRPSTNNPSTGLGTEVTRITHTATLEPAAVRITPMADGFALVVRWAGINFSGPGKIELFKINTTGSMVSGPTLITDQTGSTFTDGQQAFGVVTRADGAILIVWHQCENSQ